MQKRNVLQNTLLTRIDPSLRTNDIINTLRSIPKEIPDVEQIEFKKLFPVLLVRKRDELIFVVGDKGVERIKRYDNLPVLFKGMHQYKVRKTRFTTTFGIYINK